MLVRILDYLRHEKIASNQQIARAFAIESDALQPMLELWVKRGVIRLCGTKKSCQSCTKCQPATLDYYECNIDRP